MAATGTSSWPVHKRSAAAPCCTSISSPSRVRQPRASASFSSWVGLGVDDVVHPGSGLEAVDQALAEGTGQRCAWVGGGGHAHGRGVHHHIALIEGVLQRGVTAPEQWFQLGRPAAAGCDYLIQNRLSAPGDLNPRATQFGQASHHGACAASTAQHEGAALAPVRFRLLQRAVETLHVGVGSEPAPIALGHQHVDRPQPLCQRTELPAQPGHALLVGDGHVEAPALHGVQALDHGGQLLCRRGQGQKHPVQPHGLEGSVVHCRGERVMHRIAKKAHQRSAGADCSWAGHGLLSARAPQPACRTVREPHLVLVPLHWGRCRGSRRLFDEEVGSHGQGCRH